jgi:hypothetical protein
VSKRQRYLARLKDRCEVLRARVRDGHSKTAYEVEWQMELNALQWAIKQIEGAPSPSCESQPASPGDIQS